MIKIDRLSDKINYKDMTSEASPSFSGIVAGESMGQLWVDDITQPRIALAYSNAVGGFAFLGHLHNDNEYNRLKTSVNDTFISYLKQNGYDQFDFSIESDSLKPYILNLFQDKSLQSEKEYSYRKTEYINQEYSLPEGYQMRRVDSDLWNTVTNGAYKNEAFLTNRLLEAWGSFHNFEEKSAAFCITYSDYIAAVIIGTARFQDIVPIDIETEETFRHKGLGYFLTIEFVNECIHRSLIPQWDCVESNPISKKLAEKAGFRLYRENEVYCFDL